MMNCFKEIESRIPDHELKLERNRKRNCDELSVTHLPTGITVICGGNRSIVTNYSIAISALEGALARLKFR